MYCEFNIGDSVVCINNSYQQLLTIGRKYTIISFSSTRSHIYVYDNKQNVCGISIRRFVSELVYNRSKTIDNILK